MTDRDIVTLPDRLDVAGDLAAKNGLVGAAQLYRDASERICDLEEEKLRAEHELAELREKLRRLEGAIVIHRGERCNWIGRVHDCDRRLWEVLGDLKLNEIKGDG